MFYTPNRDDREIHMPDCDDFIVYHIKKNKLLKSFRLFQCHSSRTQPGISRKRRVLSQRKTQRTKEHIPESFPVIRQMIENGDQLENIPEHFFRSGDEGEANCSKNHTCMKVFRSLDKFFSHQRIHTNDKPFECPKPDCEMRFTQKGNMMTHVRHFHGSQGE